MNIVTYIHPIRTYLPCTGVGRHINNILLGIKDKKEVNLELFFSQEWLGKDGKLDRRCPLRELSKRTFPGLENPTERTWKLFGYPRMDKYLPEQIDWLYAPMETYIPVLKCPVAVTIHDVQAFETNLPWSRTWQHQWFRYKWGRWVRRALSDCRVVFTVSEFSKQRMVELLGGDPHKIVVVGNGVEQSFFDITSINSADLKRPVEALYTLVIGGLRQKKGGDYVLAVAKALLERKSNLKIVVAGELEADYIEAAKAHSNITLLGMVPDEELPRLLRQASSLLFLSLYEGFGMPALEAMAVGTPAIVCNRASLPEVVGDAGIVVNPEETDAIAEILINLEANPRLAEQYVQRGRKHAAEHTWLRCVNRVVTALHEFA
ncbi:MULTISPECIES: glycosyltransferase family 1 protein [unclassified Nostoc]|uniref:glycosyltransferase family 4 protein n=1 Tax=unclassified Nostoc TaxID=2593658 RepID=UPI002AD1E496|nr:glycosyltransferase family 1 protein [Nostoc sp. DedQUE03]MDZ7973510.1 glycosyltransferase family 1 protein [Nostoc sp. DedQUE03]MDZ8047251.1 glycosyltransferase family 1 protein [Nostoc sp. DedQUE02]